MPIRIPGSPFYSPADSTKMRKCAKMAKKWHDNCNGLKKSCIFAAQIKLSIAMYKSRAIPTLSGDNAEYFREIQAEMEHAESHTDWQSVGEGVITMMKKAGSKAWGI